MLCPEINWIIADLVVTTLNGLALSILSYFCRIVKTFAEIDTVTRLKVGRVDRPDLEVISKLCDFFGVTSGLCHSFCTLMIDIQYRFKLFDFNHSQFVLRIVVKKHLAFYLERLSFNAFDIFNYQQRVSFFDVAKISLVVNRPLLLAR